MTLVDTRVLGMDVEIEEIVPETDDAISIVFGTHFDYTPGQFITLRVPSEQTGSVARCYSLASSPLTDAKPKVTVKRTVSGYASNWLCDNAAPGLVLRVLPPAGTFTARHFDHDLVLFAGGSGITPIISILKSALTTSDATVSLFYANRNRDSIIFDEELRTLAERFDTRLRIEHWLESERGLPTAEALRDFASHTPGSHAFVCGPGLFMAAAETALREAGVPNENVHTERFVSLSGDPFAPSRPPEPSGRTSTVSVELDGEQHTLDWPAGSTLIDVLLAAGIDAPYSCREGECGSCACSLKSGSVNPGNVTALSADDVADGYILACQATPTSDRLDVEF